MRLHWALWLAALLAAGGARRTDQDFEFDDDADASDNSVGSASGHARRPRRYVYDPHNSLCLALVCKKREVCLLRDAFTALCANKKDILRKGDMIVPGSGSGSGGADEHAGDVFYDAGADTDADADATDRCVGCGSGAGAGGGFLCGSDNRTYSSLCRLDLHNCVRRAATPVRLACRGFCPCRLRRKEWRRRKGGAHAAHAAPGRLAPAGRTGCAPDKMANRLLDWFSVLMEEAHGIPPSRAGFPADCKPEVRWMFEHLDTDSDGLLSAAELYSLRHSERERCLRPFLSGCGGARGAWCACLGRAARPCAALARAHAGAALRGEYVPACDASGYYRPRQCHAALGVCWCVDRHGIERAGTRARGPADCTPPPAAPAPLAPPDDEDDAGSGDADLSRY